MKPAIGLLLSLMSTMHVEAYASILLVGKKNDPVQLPVLYYRQNLITLKKPCIFITYVVICTLHHTQSDYTYIS